MNPRAPDLGAATGRIATPSGVVLFTARGDARLRALGDAAEQRARKQEHVRASESPVIWPAPEVVEAAPLWTDDYSNPFQALFAAPRPPHADPPALAP